MKFSRLLRVKLVSGIGVQFLDALSVLTRKGLEKIVRFTFCKSGIESMRELVTDIAESQ